MESTNLNTNLMDCPSPESDVERVGCGSFLPRTDCAAEETVDGYAPVEESAIVSR